MSDTNITKQANTTKQTKGSKPLKIDDNVSIKVKSGFYGKLYYKNPRNGEVFIWEHAGDIQFLTIGDLKAMKAQCVGYFKKQWLVIMGVADGEDENISYADICRTLAIDIYYKNFIDPTTFGEVCQWEEDKILERVKMMSDGAKQNLIVALNGFIENGMLDSRRKIKTFEKALGCELRIND